VLPQVYTTGKYAERGTTIGAHIRRVIGGMFAGDSAKQIGNPDWRETCLALDWRKLAGDLSDVTGEMAYALDVETDSARVLGTNLGRNYPATGETEIAGTSDIEGVRIDGVPVVIDVKSGQPVTDAEHNPQLKFFALARHLLTGAPEVEGRIAYVAEDGSVRLDAHVYDAFALESYGDELRAVPGRIAAMRKLVVLGEVPPVSSGDHCTYCPAKPACPRYVALAREVVREAGGIAGADAETIPARLAAMTPEEQGAAWHKAKEVEALLKHVIDALKSLAKQEPIPLPSGKTLRAISVTSSRIVQSAALDMLREKGATEEEIATLYSTHVGEQVRTVGRAKSAPKKRKQVAA
jgi:hypothetical protein